MKMFHLNIEKRLTEISGEAGKKLHTGRSRNDQVSTDMRLYLRDASDQLVILIKKLQESTIALAEKTYYNYHARLDPSSSSTAN